MKYWILMIAAVGQGLAMGVIDGTGNYECKETEKKGQSQYFYTVFLPTRLGQLDPRLRTEGARNTVNIDGVKVVKKGPTAESPAVLIPVSATVTFAKKVGDTESLVLNSYATEAFHFQLRLDIRKMADVPASLISFEKGADSLTFEGIVKMTATPVETLKKDENWHVEKYSCTTRL